MTDLVDIRRDLRRLEDDMRRRTDAIAWGFYALISQGSETLALEFWSRWNNACARRDDEYPPPAGSKP